MKKLLNVKTVSLILAVVLLVGGAIGGTLAWIVDTQSVTNTFTYGDIEITLDEAKTNEDGQPVDADGEVVDLDLAKRTEGEEGNKYKMIPGSTYTKDPTVTVEGGSEACWLFIEVTEVNDAGTYLTYSVDATKWIAVDGTTNVYYCEVAASDVDQKFPVLTDNEVSVAGTVDKQALKDIGDKYPELTFTAYAVQKANIGTVAAAWAAAKPATNP